MDGNSSEKSIGSCYTVVYDFDTATRNWKVAGDGGWSELHLCADDADESYRILAWTHDSQEVLVNINLDHKCEYKEKSENFHSFKDENGTRRGFGFHRSERNLQSAKEFLTILTDTLTDLRRKAHATNPSTGRAPSIIATVPTIPDQASESFKSLKGMPVKDQFGHYTIVEPLDTKTKDSDATIENPMAVQHKAHVAFNPNTGEYDVLNKEHLPEGFVEVMAQKFGVPPSSLPGVEVKDYEAKLPMHLIQMKSRFVELNGCTTKGIFRLAPDAGECQRIKEMMNKGKEWWKVDCDVNVIANLLKIWYRDLPKPILNIVKPEIIEMNQSIEGVEKAINSFPEPERTLLIWLWDFCVEIQDQSEINKMNITNLGIVIGPNLFNTQNFDNPMKAMDFSQKVVTFFQKGVEWRKVVRDKK